MLQDIKAILFDLDETLIDAQNGLKIAHNRLAQIILEYLASTGVHKDMDLLTNRIRLLDDRMNRESCYNRDLWWHQLAIEIDSHSKFPDDLIQKLTIEYWNTYSENSPAYFDTIPTLTSLKQRGYKLGLVTDTDGTPGIKSMRINKLGFQDLFLVTVIAGEDTKELKPHPAPFLKASGLLDVSNNATVFVGDKPFTDIEGARAAGMKTILIERRSWNSNIKADIKIKSLEDLLILL